MIIQSLEQKTRLALMTVLLTIVGCTIICIGMLAYGYKIISDERNQVYVLDGDIPFLAERSKQEANFVMEAKAHIQLFHQYFFTLPADEDYIRWTMKKALYMADASALKQKRAMDETGFFSDIISSSATCTIICDSIKFDDKTRRFIYYGTQTIRRPSKTVRRSLVTTGYIDNTLRSENNPHGLMIVRWKTLKNVDLEH